MRDSLRVGCVLGGELELRVRGKFLSPVGDDRLFLGHVFAAVVLLFHVQVVSQFQLFLGLFRGVSSDLLRTIRKHATEDRGC